MILAAATRTDASPRAGADQATALSVGYHLGFARAAGLSLIGAVVATALLPGRH
jgi:hypothetical protein